MIQNYIQLQVLRFISSSVCLLLILSSCSGSGKDKHQGYAEGEFVFVAAPLSGQLINLAVKRGQQVKEEDKLFLIDPSLQIQQKEESEKRFLQAQSNLINISKGKRPTEIEALMAQLKSAQASLEFSQKNYTRAITMKNKGVDSEQALEEAKSRKDQDEQRVVELGYEIKTAQLGGREDEIEAAQQEVNARKAELEQAQWQLSQRQQNAPKDGLIFDTLYREGEFVPAGQPVVSLLPPQNIKVRTFISETELSSIHAQQPAKIYRDGESSVIEGYVSYISTQAEYTPPVIYSRDTRAKLVFMVEVSLEESKACELHPGQPVEVHFE